MRVVTFIAAIVTASLGMGATRIQTGVSADENGCRILRPGSSFAASSPHVIARVTVDRPPAGGRMIIDWIAPSGGSAEHAEYLDLESGRPICVLTALQVAGFQAGELPGRWRIQVRLNERVTAESEFEIGAMDDGPRIGVVAAERSERVLRLDMTGTGLSPDCTVHIARFTSAGGWRYLSAASPASADGTRMTAYMDNPLPPGEYAVIVRSFDGALSPPARLLISGNEQYRFPAAAPAGWVVTQRPYGAFSHWNRSRHAWDIAPREDRRVTAMRSGVIRASDLGMRRTPWRRSFGNYITIDHGDGEYSHYAHLQSGTFLVRSGQRVAQGQVLAQAGNSGYSLGAGGGVHLHVHVTRSASIAAQSVPFEFGKDRTAVSSGPVPALTGAVEAAQWWSGVLPVARRAKAVRVRLEWESDGSDLDLHLVSPSGKHYGWYGDSKGYSGSRARPEEIRVTRPEAGRWRVSVQGIAGGPGGIAFKVMSETE